MLLRVRIRYPPGMLEEASRVASRLSVNGVRLELVEDGSVDDVIIEGPSFTTREPEEALRILEEEPIGRPRRRREVMDEQSLPEWEWDW